ncbi:tetratricopeptide repeat protein [Deltaproteobacteria bacterium]|nr:tetratricopeptide repeat protein [Deltaproteobacteria bacterium]
MRIVRDLCGRYSGISALVILVLLVIGVYAQVNDFDFIELDDSEYVINNLDLKKGLTVDGIVWAFSENERGSFWQPLVWISFLLDYEISGKAISPDVFHLGNLFYHLLNTMLCFLLFRRLTNSIWSSLLVAIVFSVHPQRVESVAWITERKDVLFTLFGFLSLIVYLRYSDTKKTRTYFFSLFFFLLSLMSKAMAVALPCIMLLLDFWPLQRIKSWTDLKSAIYKKIPFFILTFVFSVLTFVLQSRGAIKTFEEIPLLLRSENAVVSYLSYIVDYFRPVNLCVIYPFPDHIDLWRVLLSGLVIGCISIYALYTMKKYPWVFTGWFWYVISIFPVIGFCQSGPQAMADRFMYFPHMGISLILVMALQKCYLRIIHICVVILMGVMAAACFIQVGYWENNQKLLQLAIDVTGENLIAERCLGAELYRKGDIQGAHKHFLNALRMNPEGNIEYYNMGLLYFASNKTDMAEFYFKKSLEIDPSYINAHNNLGITLINANKPEEAEYHFRMVEQLRE